MYARERERERERRCVCETERSMPFMILRAGMKICQREFFGLGSWVRSSVPPMHSRVVAGAGAAAAFNKKET